MRFILEIFCNLDSTLCKASEGSTKKYAKRKMGNSASHIIRGPGIIVVIYVPCKYIINCLITVNTIGTRI